MAKYRKLEMSAEELAWADEDAAAAAREKARTAYFAMLAKCVAAQAAFPKLYLLDVTISAENASDGMRNNEGRKLADHICDYAVLDFEYMTRNLEADTGMRMAELGLDPSAFGIRF